ncbi:MAG: polyprenyl diphosphate synthase [Eubacteriales bacterium]|nr:polyprenyl diphosphate synthase [Eubacteriales bacterium]MDD4104706.1 polyprenyl diphosphate synthase [Eubacteriales bacterium]
MSQLPKHVAIIMDGNGRWARRHKLAIALGHRKGVEALRDVIRLSSDAGIVALSIFAFSTENWRRSKEEVDALMNLILEYFRKEIDELHERDVIIRILGDKAALPQSQREAVADAERRTQNNNGLHLNIALNYGGQDEIIRAAKSLAAKAVAGEIDPEGITAQTFENELYTAGQPQVDLLIRTSGEMRISNFMLYQCAYAEMLFPEVLWPDYSVDLFKEDLKRFGQRDRRFGGRNA